MGNGGNVGFLAYTVPVPVTLSVRGVGWFMMADTIDKVYIKLCSLGDGPG